MEEVKVSDRRIIVRQTFVWYGLMLFKAGGTPLFSQSDSSLKNGSANYPWWRPTGLASDSVITPQGSHPGFPKSPKITSYSESVFRHKGLSNHIIG